MSNPIILPPLPEPVYTYDEDGNKVFYEKASLVRARDIEVARVVLEGAKNALVQASIDAKHGTDRAVLTAAAIIVRSLEVKHG